MPLQRTRDDNRARFRSSAWNWLTCGIGTLAIVLAVVQPTTALGQEEELFTDDAAEEEWNEWLESDEWLGQEFEDDEFGYDDEEYDEAGEIDLGYNDEEFGLDDEDGFVDDEYGYEDDYDYEDDWYYTEDWYEEASAFDEWYDE